ncbi:SDR family oxidoreductase [Agriterribacter sp.]|uniref:SDR family oxidoreductase n=1 Tax=Agriterribacter sp. TaxID=2821509 RepID=UPI002C6FB210|nr:SDR family oxidoreductase [Agriterribacter sp.]HRP55452.1 SDR family oxidoreductase [Agriterribacter sp.]
MSNILITGCSTGIGFATAVMLAKNNHVVFATMRHPGQNKELQDLADNKSLPIIILPLDVTDDNSIKNAIAQVFFHTGKIDVLINNAGIGALGPVEELPIENFISEMDTNFIGTVRCTKAVLPHMRQNKSGCIINISSAGGKLFNYYNASYSASKAAVEAFSECLAMEVLPFDIRVAVAEPGVTDTPLQDKCKSQLKESLYPNLERCVAFFSASNERHVHPEVVAETILQIVNGETKKFRNPTGPDTVPLLDFRASVNDEDWIASAGVDEGTWIKMMEEMGLNVRKFMPVN